MSFFTLFFSDKYQSIYLKILKYYCYFQSLFKHIFIPLFFSQDDFMEGEEVEALPPSRPLEKV